MAHPWDLLVCPSDSASLHLEAFAGPAERPAEGVLTCPHGHAYPIVDGIARMLPDAMQQVPEFVSRYRDRLPVVESRSMGNALHATRTSYSHWWTKVVGQQFYDEDAAAWLRARTGLEPEFFRGRLVLDAGCGNGRLTAAIADAGAEIVIGMDLGAGVDRAAAHARSRANAFFVQGNLLEPPFKPGTFDSVLSIGVLHHTPTPRPAFRSIARLARVGGSVSVYLYHRPTIRHDRMARSTIGQLLLTFVQAPLHWVIARLPHVVVLAFCRLLWVKRQAIEAVRRISGRLAWLLEMVPPVDAYKSYEGRELNVIRSYDYYSARFNYLHTLEEVVEWCREESLDDLTVTPYRVSVTGTKVPAPVDRLRIELRAERSAGEVGLAPAVVPRAETGNGGRDAVCAG